MANRVRSGAIRAWPVALILGAAICVWFFAAPAAISFGARSGMAEQSDFPVIRVAVNEHLRRVAAGSTYRFDFSRAADNTSTSIEEPVVVEYAGPAGSSFRLPPAGFVSLGQSAGWVYDITVALPQSAGPLDDVYATAVAVDEALARTAWRRTGEPLPSRERIRHDLADSTAGCSGTHGLGQWRFGTAELNVTLKRSARVGDRTVVPGRRLTEDLYFVEVEIYDGSRRRAYDRRLFTIREAKQHGDALRALPLDAVLDDTTPVPAGGPAR